MQIFDCKTKIISGSDALTWLDRQQCRCLLLVTDPFFRDNGWAERIAGRVQAESRTIFDNGRRLGLVPGEDSFHAITERSRADRDAR